MAASRDTLGRFKSKINNSSPKKQRNATGRVLIDHNYVGGHLCNGEVCEIVDCPMLNSLKLGKNVNRSGWREGRRIIELGVLLSNLQTCKFCGLGPVPLTYLNVVGELQRGLGGYLYVKCDNIDCGRINIAAYGKTHRETRGSKGIPSFAVNTKLGTGKFLEKIPISASAEKVTGIVLSSSGLSVNGKTVNSEYIQTAVDKFIDWVKKFPNVILVAHNGRRFDFPVLMSALMKLGIVDKFCASVCGLLDSLTVIKKKYTNMESYKQEDLVRVLLGTSYAAHNAVEDVRSLGQLFVHARLSVEEILPSTFLPASVWNQRLFNIEKAKNFGSLSPLISKGIIKTPTAENIAGSGLSFDHLKKIFVRDGEDGLSATFTCKNREGQPRVTNTKITLENIIPKLVEFFSNL